MNATLPIDGVLVGMKTPFTRHAVSAILPGRLSLSEALGQLQIHAAKDPRSAEVLQQIALETSGGSYHFLTVARDGAVSASDPSSRLHDLAVPREIKTPRGIEVIPSVAVEVQAYARVGHE